MCFTHLTARSRGKRYWRANRHRNMAHQACRLWRASANAAKIEEIARNEIGDIGARRGVVAVYRRASISLLAVRRMCGARSAR